MDQTVPKNNKTSLTASYMFDFKCIGEHCIDNCCTSSWTIAIDKQTFYKYKEVNENSLNGKISQSIKKFKSGRTAEKFGYIAQPQGASRCVFQKTCGLCEIQSELGEEALSKTCRTFPRRLKKFNNASFLTGMTSCPEIARLCLSGDVELTSNEALHNNDKKISAGTSTSKCETGILQTTINMLANYDLSPAMQVLLLVQLVEMFQTFHKAPTEIEYLLAAKKVTQQLVEISEAIDPTDASIFQYNFFESLLLQPNYNVTALEPIAVVIKQIANSFMYGSVTKAASISMYINGKTNILGNFEAKNPRLFTRLLINEVLSNAELFVHANKASSGILRDLTGRLAFTRFLLAGFANASGDGFSMDDYTKCVYLASRALEHDALKTATLEKALKQKDDNPIVTSALLVV